MGQREIDEVRHALEKGAILRILMDEFGGAPVLMATLQGVLDKMGHAMSMQSIQFALTYLEEQGYVVVRRARDLQRADRPADESPDAVVTAKLTAAGLQLVDGKRPADPLVRF